MNKEKEKAKLCTECKKHPAKVHYDHGLYCGDDLCDQCFKNMRVECRRRSW